MLFSDSFSSRRPTAGGLPLRSRSVWIWALLLGAFLPPNVGAAGPAGKTIVSESAVSETVASDPAASEAAASDTAPPADDSANRAANQRSAVVEDEITVVSGLPELATESRLGRRELESSDDSDLMAALRAVAGVSAVRRSTINLDPVVRGLREGQILATVDGSRTIAAGPARMDSGLSHVGRHAVSAVRVVKGPYALTWGPGALSAIELSTHRARSGSGWSGELGGSWSSNSDRAEGFTNLWHGGERFRAFVGLGYREGGDFEAGDGSEVPGDYQSADIRWRFGWSFSDQLELDLSGGYQQQEDIDYPGRILDATYFYTRSHSLELTWIGDQKVEKIYGQIFANRKDHLMNNDEKPTGRDMPGRVPPFALRVALPTESNIVGGRGRVDWRAADASDLEWSAGADFSRLEQTAERLIYRRSNDFLIFRDAVWPDAEVDSAGLWLQAVRGFDGGQWGGTLRVDQHASDIATPSDFFLTITEGDLDRDETHVSAAVSATFELTDRWLLQTGIGRAVRSPNVLERYSDRFPATKFQIAAEVVGDPSLDAEESLELDLGLRYNDARWNFSIEGFYRSIDHYITFLPDPSLTKRLPLSPPTVFRYINGDRATFYGFELQVDHKTHDRFSWQGEISDLRATDKTFGEPVLGIAPLTVRWTGRAEVLTDRLWLDFSAQWTDDQKRVASRRFEQPTEGYTLFDLGLELDLGSWLLELDVENLNDEAYADHLNAPNPFTGQRVLEIGRTVRVGVRLGF